MPPQAPYPPAQYPHQSYSPPPLHQNQAALYSAAPVDPPSFAPPEPPRVHTDMPPRHESGEQYSPSGTFGHVRNSPSSPTSQPHVATQSGAVATRGNEAAGPANGPLAPAPEPQQPQWKSAIEEKNEERARRDENARAEVRGGKQAARHDESDLPTYDAPANVPLKTAAQEKADLTARGFSTSADLRFRDPCSRVAARL